MPLTWRCECRGFVRNTADTVEDLEAETFGDTLWDVAAKAFVETVADRLADAKTETLRNTLAMWSKL